jgi:putative tricarboxylic transport membrane protein
VGLLLGGLLEQNLIRTWQISRGDIGYLMDRPGAIFIFAIMIASIALTTITKARRRKREELIAQRKLSPDTAGD